MTLKEAKQFTYWILNWVSVFLIIGLVLSCTPWNRDDSDEGRWFGGRSGMAIRTDHQTGCQYLESKDGALTPRMDKDGGQVGCGK